MFAHLSDMFAYLAAAFVWQLCPKHARYSPRSATRSLGSRHWQATGGILFREYCFGEENSLSLTEFWSKLGEFCQKLGEFALAHKCQAERNSLSSLPGTQWAPKKPLSSVFETVLPETVFGQFPTWWWLASNHTRKIGLKKVHCHPPAAKILLEEEKRPPPPHSQPY